MLLSEDSKSHRMYLELVDAEGAMLTAAQGRAY